MTLQRILLIIARRSRSGTGQDLAEYGLLVGFIALVVIVAASLFGTSLLNFWNELRAGLPF